MDESHLNVFPFENRSLMQVLALLWRFPGFSRFEIASRMGQTSVSAVKQVNRLLGDGLLREGTAGATGSRGRRMIPLFLRRDLFYCVGVAYNRQEATVVLVDASGTVLEEKHYPELPARFPERADVVIEGVREMLRRREIPYAATVGVGVTVPGILTPQTGEVAFSPEFAEDLNFNLGKRFEEGIRLPVGVVNVPHALAFLEQHSGRGKGVNSFLYFDLPGYGLGMVLNGKPYSGTQGRAGECGMMQIYEHGPTGIDGRIGTLSTVVPFYKLTDRLTEMLKENPNLMVAKFLKPGEKKVTLPMIAKAIREGDLLCAQLMGEQFDAVARATVNLAYILNPDVIFLPPWTADCPEVSIDIVRRQMGHYGAYQRSMSTKIEPAQFGKEDLALAASLMPIRNCFEKYYPNGC